MLAGEFEKQNADTKLNWVVEYATAMWNPALNKGAMQIAFAFL